MLSGAHNFRSLQTNAPGSNVMIRKLALSAVAVASLAACASAPHQTAQPIISSTASRPLSAIVVSQCGLAVALYIQLDPTHLLRADSRQSDLFAAVDGQQQQTGAGPMPWDQAYSLAGSAVLTSHVLLPCTDGPST
jgi:hypothetical protein